MKNTNIEHSPVWDEPTSIAIMEYIIAGYNVQEAKAKVIQEMGLETEMELYYA